MAHSIAAKYAARPAARFVRPSSRARERRLGLGSVVTFSPAVGRATELQRSGGAGVASLHAGWRSPRPIRPAVTAGRPRPTVRMRWTHSDGRGSGRSRRADAAPWPG
jgi:hypothetical protein